MKFVTVMDMWLLIMNGILLGAILYYGRKVVNLIKATHDETVDEKLKKAVASEKARIVNIIEKELNIFKTAENIGDDSFKPIISEIEVILREIKR